MKIIASELLEILKQLEPALSKTEVNPLLACFQFSPGVIEAYSGIVYGRVKMKDLDITGLINSKALFDVLSMLGKKDIVWEQKDTLLKITKGTFVADLSVIPINEADSFSTKIDKKHKFTEITLPEKDDLTICASIIRSGTYAPAAYRGMSIKNKFAIVTDGFRLYRFAMAKPIPGVTFIPGDVLAIAEALGDSLESVSVSDDVFKIASKTVEFFIKVNQDDVKDLDLELQFASMSKKLSKLCEFTLPEKINEVIERISVASKNTTDKLCMLKYDGKILHLTASTGTLKVEEKVKLDAGVAPFTTSVNYEYFLELLNHAGNDLTIAKLAETQGIIYVADAERYYLMVITFPAEN